MRKTWFEKKLGDISMLVIIIPGIAFLMTYAFEIGYCGYFNIPVGLITIDAKEIASMVMMVLIAIFCLYLFDFALLQFFFKFFFNCYPYGSKIYQDQYLNYSCNTIFVGLLISLSIISPIPKNLFIMFLFVPALLLISFIISHISFQRKKKKNIEIQMVEEDNNDSDKEVSGIVSLILGPRLIVSILFVICLFLFIMSFGSFAAKKQKLFYSIDNRSDVVGIIINNNQVVVKFSGDQELSKTEVIDVSSVMFIEEIENPEFYKLVTDFNESKKKK